jgi:hypothetical protein
MERRYFLTTAIAGAALVSWPAARALSDDTLSNDEVVDIVFEELERVIIEEYFGYGADQGNGNKDKDKNKGLPPGLAKRDQLPPGLARQVERNGTLPPGLRTYDLPSDLLSRLPSSPKGTRRVVVGNDVVLIREGTRYILDVIKDVIAP